jgi:uncharacterized protein (DUF169 family)
MNTVNYVDMADQLVSQLALESPPLAITFSDAAPAGIPQFEGEMPPPTPDGRTGKVPAGCVFWMKATERTFTTMAEDHGNCSVGGMTHGFRKMDEIGANADVEALLESGWVTMEMVPAIPVVRKQYQYVTYGPLAETALEPDVVFMRLNAKQAMVLSDALPELRFEGKPQCHIIAIAKEQQQFAVSVGCMLSRVRTGMPNTEMTCAIPGSRLAELVERLSVARGIDSTVAGYASEDSKRFVS